MAAVASRYQAPGVRYPVARSQQLGCILLALSVPGLLVSIAWWFLADVGLLAMLAAISAWAGASLLAWRFWQRSPTGFLVWDGQGWTLDSPQIGAIEGVLTIHLDLQRSLWVCLAPSDAQHGAPLWLWLEQSQCAALWMDLRRGLYSRPRLGAADNLAQADDHTP